MSPPEFVKESTASYSQSRWGDYSAVVSDPVDTGFFWMHHEYTPGSNSWHTWIGGEPISPEGSYLTLGSTRISDDELGQSEGNGDGDLNPSETIELWVTLRNIGQEASTNVSGVLSSFFRVLCRQLVFWSRWSPFGGSHPYSRIACPHYLSVSPRNR